MCKVIFRLTEQEVVSLPDVDTWESTPGEDGEERRLRGDGGLGELQEG